MVLHLELELKLLFKLRVQLLPLFEKTDEHIKAGWVFRRQQEYTPDQFLRWLLSLQGQESLSE